MTLFHTASLSDFNCFFAALDYMAIWRGQPRFPSSWDLIRKNLYRRYLRPDQLDAALAQMRDIQAYFATLGRDFVDWSQHGPDSLTVLNPSRPTMADIFAVFFEKFELAVAEAKYVANYEAEHHLPPDNSCLKIVIAVPIIPGEVTRSLAEYDELADDAIPFWARLPPPNQKRAARESKRSGE